MVLQLENLEVHDDVALPKTTRTRTPKDPTKNPMYAFMVKSNDQRLAGENPGKSIPNVPVDQARELIGLLRRAAISLDIGTRIVITSADGQTEMTMGKVEDGQNVLVKATNEPWTEPVTVMFSAKPKTERKPKAESNGSTPTDSAPTETETAGTAETGTGDATPAEASGRRNRRK